MRNLTEDYIKSNMFHGHCAIDDGNGNWSMREANYYDFKKDCRGMSKTTKEKVSM